MLIHELSPTKLKILLASEQLFRKNAYDATSMRMIADACNMAVGNLCYHYPKKEDILMLGHNVLMDSFMGHVAGRAGDDDPWVTYIGAEYDFLLRIAEDQEILNIFREVINVPSLRQSYYMKHQEFMETFFSASDFGLNDHEFYISTVSFSSLCYQLLEQYDSKHREDFDESLVKAFQSKFLYLGLDPFKMEPTIRRGMELGRKTFASVSNKELFYGDTQ